MDAFFLYNSSIIHPHLPLVDIVSDFLDAGPKISLFKRHFHINAASEIGAKHLIWW